MSDQRHAGAGAESAPDDGQVTPTGPQTPPAVTYCEECRAWDDHPKLHYGTRTMHHDCAPASIRREVLGDGSVHSVTDAATRAAFEGADRGLRGAKLRGHIQKTHDREAARVAAEAPPQDDQGSQVTHDA